MKRLVLSSFLLLAGGGCAASHKPTPAPTPVHEEPAPEPVPAASAEPVPTTPQAEGKDALSTAGTIERRALTHVLDQAPGRFLQHVEIVPRFRSGRFHGWRLVSFFPGDPRFASVDLRSGDVVTAVNGQPIEQPDQLMKVWESLRQDPALTVSVERDGRPRQLRYDIRD